MQQLSYLAVLVACILGTLPLELLLHANVYRRWQRAILAILPVAAVFVTWDYLATHAGWWWFDEQYLIGLFAGVIPLEELLFFLVIPVCGILTFEAVRRLRPDWAAGLQDVAADQPAAEKS